MSAGGIAILSGAAALFARKGGRVHRAVGTAFFVSMLTMLAIGAYLAAFVQTSVVIPKIATVIVAVLTLNLVVTSWVTVRRKDGGVGAFEKAATLLSLGLAIALFLYGVQAAASPQGMVDGAPAQAYFAFASFAAFVFALDTRVVLRGGIAGVPRIARHLWRMCAALLFASAFFFLGQGQKIMPAWLQGSPWLYVPALAPLVMIFWLVRIRFANVSRKDALAF